MRTHRVDFHTHTNFSDGALTLAELAKNAKDTGLELIVVCDHDTFKTFSPASIELARQSIPDLEDCGDTLQAGRLKIVKGIEFSANHKGRQIHLVGAYLKNVLPEIQTYFDTIGEERKIRAKKLAERVSVDFDDVLRAAGPATSITRLHITRVIYDKKHPQYTSACDISERIIPRKHKDYLPVAQDMVMPAGTVITTILAFGGIPIWAHPAMEKGRLEETMKELQKYANTHLFVEGYSGNCRDFENKRVIKAARSLGIPILKSSDYHGMPMKDNKLGYEIGHSEYKTLMKAIKNHLKYIRASIQGKAQ